MGGHPCQNLRMHWKHEKGAHYTNKELCLLPSANRTSLVKASNMLPLTPGGDGHGERHWYWTGGLMPPMELPFPVCSADPWLCSPAMPGLQELVRHWTRVSTTGDPVGQKCHPCDSSVASKRAAQPGVSTQGEQRWTKAEGEEGCWGMVWMNYHCC